MIPKREYNTGAIEALESIPRGTTIREVVAAYVLVALMRNGNNRTHTALELGIPYRTFINKLAALSCEGYTVPESEVTSKFTLNLKANRKNKDRLTKLNDF
jgi:DNA-binding NtrC family response regulator